MTNTTSYALQDRKTIPQSYRLSVCFYGQRNIHYNVMITGFTMISFMNQTSVKIMGKSMGQVAKPAGPLSTALGPVKEGGEQSRETDRK